MLDPCPCTNLSRVCFLKTNQYQVNSETENRSELSPSYAKDGDESDNFITITVVSIISIILAATRCCLRINKNTNEVIVDGD